MWIDWISVDDDLPKVGDTHLGTQNRKLVCTEKGFVGEAWLNASKRWIRNNNDIEIAMGCKVTHWADMPKAILQGGLEG